LGTDVVWSAEADFERGIGAFIILRDGQELAKLPQTPAGRFGRPLFQSMTYHGYQRPTRPEIPASSSSQIAWRRPSDTPTADETVACWRTPLRERDLPLGITLGEEVCTGFKEIAMHLELKYCSM
jgi:hypothetical protein